MARRRIFTIFDKMEDDGVFESNPANLNSRGPQGQIIHKGPVKFPKMVYHPEGHFAIQNKARPEVTPFGPQMLNESRELISKVVENEAEYAEAREAGWLDTPAEASAKNPERKTGAELAGQAPKPVDARDARIAELEAKLEAAAKGKSVTPKPTEGAGAASAITVLP